jgi:iron complex transport system substrate-binding protein
MRVVSAGGSVTEWIMEIDPQSNIVGVDLSSVYPASIASIPKIGYHRTLSLEGILSLKPDLFIASDEAGPPNVIQQIQDAKIRTLILKSERSEEAMIHNIKLLSVAFGKIERGIELEQKTRQNWKSFEEEKKKIAKSPSKALFLFSRGSGGFQAAGKGTIGDKVLQQVNANNPLSTYPGYLPLTTEGLMTVKPDCFIVSAQALQALGGQEAFWKIPGVQYTPAAQTKSLIALDELAMMGFGPRLPQTLHQLLKQLYGI